MLTFSLGFSVGLVAGIVIAGGVVGVLFLNFLDREESEWRGGS